MVRVVGGDVKGALREGKPHRAVLLVGEDRGPLERPTDRLPAHLRLLVALFGAWNDPVIVREPPFDQAAGEGDVPEGRAKARLPDHDVHRLVRPLDQPQQLLHPLPGQDALVHLLAGRSLLKPDLRLREPVTVRRYGAKPLTPEFEQQAVQVVAHVLVGHCEMRPLDQLLEVTLGDRRLHLLTFNRLRLREIIRRERVEGEPAPPRPQHRAILIGGEFESRVLGQGSTDIHQLAGRHRHPPRFSTGRGDPRHQLDLHVGSRQ